MKKVILIIMVMILFSLQENKIEFVKSNVKSLILVKNPPKDETKLKLEIKKYLENNFPDKSTYIYIYSGETSYFINKPV